MEQVFIASLKRRTHSLAFCGPAPFRGGSNFTRISSEAKKEDLSAKSFSCQLAQINFAVLRHFGGPGISEMRIVGPHYDLCPRPGLHQQTQDLGHVPVAEVPGFSA